MTPAVVPSPPAFVEVRIAREALRALRSHSERSYPEEACGLLLGPLPAVPVAARRDPESPVREVDEAREVPNRKTEERTHRFLIPSDELRAAERELEGTSRGVVGFYHSHPDHPARPSGFDQDHAWPWYTYLVLAVDHGQAGDLGVFELDPEGRVFQPRRMTEGERP